eukprot:6291935-Alexandrium_andersonii.AAC.1
MRLGTSIVALQRGPAVPRALAGIGLPRRPALGDAADLPFGVQARGGPAVDSAPFGTFSRFGNQVISEA